ncbi:hypothetical protein ACI65C_000996 [Semiaphis heraclei]
MPSSSGGTNRASRNSISNKHGNQHVKNIAGTGYQLVRKNGKPIKNSSCPVSPSFQQIMDNPPTLDISSSTFNYSSLSTQTAITSAGSMAIDMDVNVNDRPNELDSGSTSDPSDDYGGVAIAVHNCLKSKQIPLDVAIRNSFTHHKIDIIGVEVHLVNSHPSLKCYLLHPQ